MSKRVDKDFPTRLEKSAEKAGVAYQPTPLGKFLGANKQTVATWMAGSLPRADKIFEYADKFGVDPRWFATGEGDRLGRASTGDLPADEQLLLERYRGAEPRWRLSLQLLAGIAADDQIEAASDVNMVIARIAGMKPHQVNPAGDKRLRDILKNSPQGWPPRPPAKEKR